MGALGRDLRYAARVFLRTPSFTLPALVSLALGIAATTTIFTVVNALILRPVAAGRGTLVRVGQSIRSDGTFRAVSHPEFLHLRDHATSFAGLVGHQPQPVTVAGTTSGALGPRVVWSEIVTGAYFQVLQVVPAFGRGFLPEDDRVPGERAVLVISDSFWRRGFNGDTAVIGRTLVLNNHRFTIVGVAPPGFRGTFPGFDIDLWAPAMMLNVVLPGADRLDRQGDRFLMLIGRLQPHATIESARAELQTLAGQLAQAHPDANRDRTFQIAAASGVHPFLAGIVKGFLALLMAIVSVVLLIACANVANLLLARAGARRRELAVRLAVGAGRWTIVRQLLTESIFLACVGAILGLMLTFWSVRVLNAFHPPTGVPIALDLVVDLRVLMFALGASMLSAVVFGLAPALQATRVDLAPAIKDEASQVAGARSWLRGALVVIQVALSLVLLVGALLMVRSLHNSKTLGPGFDPDQVVVTSFDPQMLGYSREKVEAFYDELLRRVRALPGAERAAFADFVLLGDRGDEMPFTIAGRAPAGQGGDTVEYNRISTDYFAAVRIPVLRGRDFTERDRRGAPLVAIVNAAFEQRYWRTGEALGKRIKLRGDDAEREIVGVVQDVKYRGYGEPPRPFLYVPASQRYRSSLTLHLRSALSPADATAAIRSVASAIDKDVPAYDARPMREAMAFALVPVEIARTVFAVAGLIAVLLASSGLYGVVSYTTSQRMHEIGIRIALGAPRSHVFRVIVGGTLTLALAGVVLGLGAAAVGSRALTIFIYGMSPTDPLTFLAVAGMLLTVAGAAGYAGARKGLAVDPVVALRHE